jgi:hypothetical protein
MSYRELWVLVQYLPQESWTQTILRDDPERQALVNEEPAERKFGPWSQRDFLTAALIDAVNRNTYVTEIASDRFKDPRPPEPFPRPGLAVAGERPAVETDEYVQAKVLYLKSIRAKG